MASSASTDGRGLPPRRSLSAPSSLHSCGSPRAWPRAGSERGARFLFSDHRDSASICSLKGFPVVAAKAREPWLEADFRRQTLRGLTWLASCYEPAAVPAELRRALSPKADFSACVSSRLTGYGAIENAEPLTHTRSLFDTFVCQGTSSTGIDLGLPFGFSIGIVFASFTVIAEAHKLKMGAARRSHTKSRNGCQECKRKRIKVRLPSLQPNRTQC